MMQHRYDRIQETIEKLDLKVSKYWQNIFKTVKHLGVLKESGKMLLPENLPQAVDEVRYLYDETGIVLPIIIGGGPFYDDLPGFEKRKVGGLRVTPPSMMQNLYPAAMENLEMFVQALQNNSVPARAIMPDNFEVDFHEPVADSDGNLVDLGCVGDFKMLHGKPYLDVSSVFRSLDDDEVPVMSHIGYNNGTPLNLNATIFAAVVNLGLGGKKLIAVGNKAVKDKDGNTISAIYSRNEFNRLRQEGIFEDEGNLTTASGMELNIETGLMALDYMGPGHAYHLTEPKFSEAGIESSGLLEEMLSDGNGTIILKPYPIMDFGIDYMQNEKFIRLLNDSFNQIGKKVSEAYFSIVRSKLPTVHAAVDPNSKDDFKGFAITYPLGDALYIDKFGTHPDYEGIGVGQSIMDYLVRQNNKLIWRSDKSNPNVRFYERIMDHYEGTRMVTDDYFVYFVGFDTIDPIIVDHVARIPKTVSLK
ncbi:hypothetical protein H6503_06910 [Candidatus Woesearchaeota archaeon]|nr:hypothetical protein [Candidatus Woesearchaeota archaeon]